MRRRTLITSPLSWQMRAAPVSPPLVPVLAERGGTQLNAPQAKILVDSREQNPFDFSPVSRLVQRSREEGAQTRGL
jgi:hypothetical protein